MATVYRKVNGRMVACSVSDRKAAKLLRKGWVSTVEVETETEAQVEVETETEVDVEVETETEAPSTEDKTDAVDTDGNGYLKKDEIMAKLDELGVTYKKRDSRDTLLGLLEEAMG